MNRGLKEWLTQHVPANSGISSTFGMCQGQESLRLGTTSSHGRDRGSTWIHSHCVGTGGFLKWGYPNMDGLFQAKSYGKMDEIGYPHGLESSVFSYNMFNQLEFMMDACS